MAWPVYQLSTARKEISGIFNQVAINRKVIEVKKRGVKNSMAMAPLDIIQKLMQEADSLTVRLARIVAEHLLPGADESFIEPQIHEFSTVSIDKLSQFLAVSLPFSHEVRAKLVDAVGEKMVSRLEKRYALSRQMKQAEEEGLFESSEHAANLLNL